MPAPRYINSRLNRPAILPEERRWRDVPFGQGWSWNFWMTARNQPKICTGWDTPWTGKLHVVLGPEHSRDGLPDTAARTLRAKLMLLFDPEAPARARTQARTHGMRST